MHMSYYSSTTPLASSAAPDNDIGYPNELVVDVSPRLSVAVVWFVLRGFPPNPV